MEYTKDLSIVISLFNEEESLAELVAWIETVMLKEGYSYEILMIDDGSRDSSWEVVKGLAAKNPAVRGMSGIRVIRHLQENQNTQYGRWSIFRSCDGHA